MQPLSLSSVKIATDAGAEDGLLVFNADVLHAVLVCLDSAIYQNERGQWHLEVGFGPCAAQPRTFADLATALRWLAERIGMDADAAVAAGLAQYRGRLDGEG